MRLQAARSAVRGSDCCPDAMRAQLAQALQDALDELEMLPHDQDGALIGLYAVMDDLEQAIQRTEALDLTTAD